MHVTEGGCEKLLERTDTIVYFGGVSFCLQLELSIILVYVATFTVSETSGFLS